MALPDTPSLLCLLIGLSSVLVAFRAKRRADRTMDEARRVVRNTQEILGLTHDQEGFELH